MSQSTSMWQQQLSSRCDSRRRCRTSSLNLVVDVSVDVDVAQDEQLSSLLVDVTVDRRQCRTSSLP